jgi:hypothetical protein
MFAIIKKLSPYWKNFKDYLKYKQKEMEVKDLILRLIIKEDIKLFNRRVDTSLMA